MTHLILRSWPEPVPPHRAHIADALPRLVIRNYDYRPLAALRGPEAVVIIEWDIAVDAAELAGFTRRAQAARGLVRVAPYRTGDPAHRDWVHRDAAGQPVTEGQPFCTSFGFGLAWLPMAAVREFCDHAAGQPDPRMTDSNFSAWWGRGAYIDWSVRPVHLH